MQYLLMRGREYRSELENQSQIVSPAQFPAHGRTDIWTKEQLNKYSEFVGIRLYQVDIRTSDDGTEVVAYSKRRLMEYHDSSENITVTETRREEGS